MRKIFSRNGLHPTSGVIKRENVFFTEIPIAANFEGLSSPDSSCFYRGKPEDYWIMSTIVSITRRDTRPVNVAVRFLWYLFTIYIYICIYTLIQYNILLIHRPRVLCWDALEPRIDKMEPSKLEIMHLRWHIELKDQWRDDLFLLAKRHFYHSIQDKCTDFRW